MKPLPARGFFFCRDKFFYSLASTDFRVYDVSMVMGIPPAAKNADSAMAFVENLREVYLTDRYLPTLRQSFKSAAERLAPFSPGQQDFLRQYASSSAHDMIDEKLSAAWHLFDDHIRKRVCVQSLTGRALNSQLLLEMAVHMRWTTHNFPVLLGLEPSTDVPVYPARPGSIEGAAAALGYMQHRLLPVLKGLLLERYGCSQEALEERLALLSDRLEQEGVPGFEILRPVPPRLWEELTARGPVVPALGS